MSQAFVALIFAAGTPDNAAAVGPRHVLLGRSLLRLVLDAVVAAGASGAAVVSDRRPGAEDTAAAAAARPPAVLIGRRGSSGWPALGSAARRFVADSGARDVLALPADLALLRGDALRPLLRQHRKDGNDLTLLVREEAEASPAAGLFRREAFLRVLAGVSRGPGRAASSLDPFVEFAVLREMAVGACRAGEGSDLVRVRNLEDSSRAAAVLRARKVRDLLRSGVAVLDPATVWVDLDVEIGPGTVLYPSVVLEGRTRIGRDCRIYPHVHLRDAGLGDRVRVLSSTVVEECELGDDVQAGPFSRLRPRTVLEPGSRVGNFVEMKNTRFGPGAKALHLSYLGDAVVEEKVNIGAGTITCNYDGVTKNPTYIEAGAFIGSGTELVAPVRIGRGAYVAAGSTITKDVAPDALALSRGRQVEKPGWAARKRRKKQS